VLSAILIAAPLSLALAVGGGMWLSRRAIAPVDAVIREANELTARDLRRRLPLPARNDELRDLVVAINALLARLNEGFDALERYAESAAHELRTPLAVLTSELEVALRRPRTQEDWERIALASLEELRRMTRLVTALLELSRVDGSPGSPQEVELSEIVDSARRGLGSLAADRGIALNVPPAPGCVSIKGSPDPLASAVHELVRNAIHHSPSGSVVCVRLESLVGRDVAIHVDDAGPGIDSAEREAVFLPFVRGKRRRTTHGGTDTRDGFGLGLAIAKRSVERSGGSILVGKSPEGGARFTIVLPAGRSSERIE
jgi:two-component system OmpR family sensor kinase